MNKTAFIVALASLAMVFSCSQPGAYSISGESTVLNDGDTVFVARREGREMVHVDSAIVNAGKFAFKGVQETPEMLYMNYPDTKGKRVNCLFFLEEGKMKAVIDSTSCTISGSANNDIFNDAQALLNPLWDKMNGAWRGYFAPTTTDEMRAEMTKKHDQYLKEYAAAAANVAYENVNNPVGIYYLKDNYSRFEPEDLYKVIEAIPEDVLAADERLANIKSVGEKKYATRPGQKFTDFTMQTPDGAKISLSDYAGKGKYVLVDFWASWCGPCCREMPNVVELYNKYKKTGKFEIVGVSLDDEADSWKKALGQYNMTWPQMSDLKGWKCEGSGLYGVNAIPHTVLIDPDGVILERDLRSEKLAAKLAELIK